MSGSMANCCATTHRMSAHTLNLGAITHPGACNIPGFWILRFSRIRKRAEKRFLNQRSGTLGDESKRCHRMRHRLTSDEHQNLIYFSRTNANVICFSDRFHKSSKSRRFLSVCGTVTPKETSGRHFAETVTYHLFRNKNG